jgi:hypothetical protein
LNLKSSLFSAFFLAFFLGGRGITIRPTFKNSDGDLLRVGCISMCCIQCKERHNGQQVRRLCQKSFSNLGHFRGSQLHISDLRWSGAYIFNSPNQDLWRHSWVARAQKWVASQAHHLLYVVALFHKLETTPHR